MFHVFAVTKCVWLRLVEHWLKKEARLWHANTRWYGFATYSVIQQTMHHSLGVTCLEYTSILFCNCTVAHFFDFPQYISPVHYGLNA